MIFYLEKSASSQKFEEALLEELKTLRPKCSVPVEQSSDKIFCNYIVNLISEIPQNKKRKLQGELVKSILREMDD